MRKAIVTAIVLLAGCQHKPEPKTVGQAQKQTRSRLSATEEFNLRTKCAEIAQKGTEDYKWGIVGVALSANISNHYDPARNRCYVEVYVTKNFSYEGKSSLEDNYVSDALYDAQTADLLISANQNGAKSHGNLFEPFEPRSGSFTDFQTAVDKIHELMHEE